MTLIEVSLFFQINSNNINVLKSVFIVLNAFPAIAILSALNKYVSGNEPDSPDYRHAISARQIARSISAVSVIFILINRKASS